MPGTLFVVATPIGNLEDITLRALRVLREVAAVAAEDTRRTSRLLQHFGIQARTVSLHEHNERQRTAELVRELRDGQSVALVSDAGTPMLSDPGFALIRAAIAEGIRVEPVPGPSALTAALSAAGVPTDTFTFAGFSPARQGERQRWLNSLKSERRTVVFFEAPHRIRATLADALAILGDRWVVIAREVTKLHETFVRGWVSEVVADQQLDRGELTVLLTSLTRPPVAEPTPPPSAFQIAEEVGRMTKDKSLSKRDAVQAVATRLGLPAQDVYRALKDADGG
jgi:16S rRNA (cytidine1402-2'-O)-methyltransferase